MSSYQSVLNAVTRRISMQRIDLLEKYGPTEVMDAIESVASRFEDRQLDEIGSSDVSCWVMDVQSNLERM